MKEKGGGGGLYFFSGRGITPRKKGRGDANPPSKREERVLIQKDWAESYSEEEKEKGHKRVFSARIIGRTIYYWKHTSRGKDAEKEKGELRCWLYGEGGKNFFPKCLRGQEDCAPLN